MGRESIVERAAARAIVDEVRSYGAFMLVDREALWIHRAGALPDGLRRRVWQNMEAVLQVLLGELAAEVADDD